MYWDEIKVGASFESAARTITEADIVNFAGLSGDFNPIHTDAVFASATIFGSRIAHGLLGLSIASGLLTRTSGLGPDVIAFLGINEWRFSAPIRIGDTIRARSTVTRTRSTREPDRGIVIQRVDVVNQHDQIVQSGEFVVMIRRTTNDQ